MLNDDVAKTWTEHNNFENPASSNTKMAAVRTCEVETTLAPFNTVTWSLVLLILMTDSYGIWLRFFNCKWYTM
jgi:hypothetical protein